MRSLYGSECKMHMVSSTEKRQHGGYMSNDTELHIVLIWSNGVSAVQEIIADMTLRFDIVEKYMIQWSKDNFPRNLTRFYGKNLPAGSFKEKHCGVEPFLLFLVRDNHPCYGLRETSRGFEKVNTNIFDAKTRYREMTGGGHKVHTTNSPQECAHDLYLLLGKKYGETLAAHRDSPSAPPAFVRLEQELKGDKGWASLAEMFDALNHCVPYVVLRNFEILPQDFRLKEHGDIDLLVENIFNAASVLGAEKTSPESYRVDYSVVVNNERVPLDLRHVGDDYYCSSWEADMLESRVMNENGIYIPSPAHYHHALTYHAIFQKRVIATDYHTKLLDACVTAGYTPAPVHLFDGYFRDLTAFISHNDYRLTRSKDLSVAWDSRYSFRLRSIQSELATLDIHDVALFKCDNAKLSVYPNRLYFKGVYGKEREPVFIKWGGGFTVKREFDILQKLTSVDKKHFPIPILYKISDSASYLVESYVGEPEDPYVPVAAPEFIEQEFTQILETLAQCNIVHRVICPENVIFKSTGVCVVDFGLAVDLDENRLPEVDIFNMTLPQVKNIGKRYAPAPLQWDDAFSFFLLATKDYGVKPEYLRSIRARIGKKPLHLKA